MAVSDMVLVRGMADTRATLAGWNERPWPTLRTWLLGSVGVALLLLFAVWVVATRSTPDPSPFHLPGYDRAPRLIDVVGVLEFNSLVLALHGFACVAGFIAGSSLPLAADRYSGLWRRIHDHAGPVAIAFVSAATLFSLSTQAYVLGNDAATLSDKLGISPALLLLGLLPHALPELTALFLPLAAWLIASRRGDWHQLLAATFVTVGIAIPTLVTAAIIEVYVSPHLLALLAS
jgi:hypothetical protein